MESSLKRVCILIISLRGGGAERVASLLLNKFQEDFEMHLVMMSKDISYSIPSGQRVWFLEDQPREESAISRILRLPLLSWKLYRYCKKNNIDVVLSFMYRPNFINVLSTWFGSKHKVLVSERSNPAKKNSLFKLLVKRLYPKADLVLPNSFGNAEVLRSNFSVKDNLKVIQNPVDLDHIATINPGVKSDKFVFVTVGRLHPLKLQEVIIKAFFELNQSETELWLVGDGPQESMLKELCDSLGIAEKVKFLGFQNPFPILKSADCFVFASSFEGFPNVLVEAMACGLPVISSDCESGPREILAPNTVVHQHITEGVENAGNGILVPVNEVKSMTEAMSRVFEDKELQRHLRNRSCERAKDFDVPVICKEFKSVIDEA